MSNKIKESNITDGAVTSNKIAPGTIANDRLAGSIAISKLATDPTNASNIASGTLANARLTGSGAITINGNSVALGGSVVAGTDWQAVVTSDTTMVAGKGYFVDSSGGAKTMTLPASPSIGDEVSIVALDGSTNSVTIARNGNNIEGGTSNLVLDRNYNTVTLVYSDAANGWYRHTKVVADSYIIATGGTETTSGKYKIHTFNYQLKEKNKNKTKI